MFGFLFFVKVFHWLSHDRMEYVGISFYCLSICWTSIDGTIPKCIQLNCHQACYSLRWLTSYWFRSLINLRTWYLPQWRHYDYPLRIRGEHIIDSISHFNNYSTLFYSLMLLRVRLGSLSTSKTFVLGKHGKTNHSTFSTSISSLISWS